MAAEPVTVADRYQLVERLGAGGMGEVWKARDLVFENKFVAIKLLKDDETRRQDLESRERLERGLRKEPDKGRIPLEAAARLLREALGTPRGMDKIRAQLGGQASGDAVTATAALSAYDALSDDPDCNDNAKIRKELRTRFKREANAVAGLNHPNIVSISDFNSGEDGRVPFLAMDYIEGLTLAEVIKRGEPLPLPRRLELMEHLCAGLAYAHRHGLVHRDIKPANLIIEETSGLLRILDFGVVRRLDQKIESSIGLVIGTMCYMSPEQIRASRSLDGRSDIFAAGDVLYEFLSGEKAFPPHDDEMMAGLLDRIQKEAPTPIRDLVADLPAAIEPIINKALEKDPANRYQDADLMRRDLARVRERLNVIASDPTIPVNLVDVWLREGEQAMAAGHFDLALSNCHRVLEREPTNSAARALEGRILERRKAHELGELVTQTRHLIAAGDLTGAETALETTLRIDDKAPEVVALATEVARLRADRDRTAKFDEQLRQAQAALASGDLERAVEAVAGAIAIDGARPEGPALRQEIEAKIQARQAAAHAAAVAAVVAEADRLARDGDAAAGLRHLAQATVADPSIDAKRAELEVVGRVNALLAEARAARREGRFGEADARLVEARKLAPSRADVTRELAETREEAERVRREAEHRAAVKAFLLEVDRLVAAGDLDAAATRLAQSQLADAAIEAKKASVDLLRRVSVLAAEARAARRDQRLADAVARLTEASRLAPDRQDIARELAETESLLDQYNAHVAAERQADAVVTRATELFAKGPRGRRKALAILADAAQHPRVSGALARLTEEHDRLERERPPVAWWRTRSGVTAAVSGALLVAVGSTVAFKMWPPSVDPKPGSGTTGTPSSAPAGADAANPTGAAAHTDPRPPVADPNPPPVSPPSTPAATPNPVLPAPPSPKSPQPKDPATKPASGVADAPKPVSSPAPAGPSPADEAFRRAQNLVATNDPEAVREVRADLGQYAGDVRFEPLVSTLVLRAKQSATTARSAAGRAAGTEKFTSAVTTFTQADATAGATSVLKRLDAIPDFTKAARDFSAAGAAEDGLANDCARRADAQNFDPESYITTCAVQLSADDRLSKALDRVVTRYSDSVSKAQAALANAKALDEYKAGEAAIGQSTGSDGPAKLRHLVAADGDFTQVARVADGVKDLVKQFSAHYNERNAAALAQLYVRPASVSKDMFDMSTSYQEEYDPAKLAVTFQDSTHAKAVFVRTIRTKERGVQRPDYPVETTLSLVRQAGATVWKIASASFR